MARFSLVRTMYWTLLLNVLVVSCATAAVPLPLTVGDIGCNFLDLQSAINNPNAVTTVIHVKANYAGKPIHIDHGGYFVIAGGYPDCNPDSTPIPFNGILENLSILDGSLEKDGHGDQVPQPVISVSGGSSALSLSNFQVRFGNNSGHDGGGIRYETVPGDDLGHLELQTVDVHHNVADRGAGIFFRGHGTTNELILSNDSYIEFNTADFAGGGIRLEGNTILTAESPQTTISNNTANPGRANDGLGGGLQVLDQSKAYIGSPGFNGRAVIEGNHARFGGGIAIGGDANVHLYMVQAGSPARVEYNDASINGGGVYLKPNGDDDSTPKLDGFNVGINHNSARDGAAIYGDSVDREFNMFHPGSNINFSSSALPTPGAVACIGGSACNSMDDNNADTVSGAIVSMQGDRDALFSAEQLEIRGNSASHILTATKLNDSDSMVSLFLTNCLIAENKLSEVIFIEATMDIDGCTVANNNISAGDVFRATGEFVVTDSIVWQPGHTTMGADHSATEVFFRDSIFSDAGTLDASIVTDHVQGDDPLFVHPDGGNYQLKFLSPAIDYAKLCARPPTGSSQPVDLINNARQVVLRNSAARCDIGAYERQAIALAKFPLDEDFSEANNDPYALDLPEGWTSIHAGISDGWFVGFDTLFNEGLGATVNIVDGNNLLPNTTAQSDSALISPLFEVAHAGQVSFDQRFSLETNYDGAILEISIDGGVTFQEITAAGGHFVSGGYSGVLLHGNTPNPIEAGCPGCMAWTGDTNGILHTVVSLPPTADGKDDVRLSWRVGSDGNGPGGYYWLDNIHVDAGVDRIFKNGFDAD